MQRRGVLVVAGAVLTGLLAAGIPRCPLPYVVRQPGPTVDTAAPHVITVTGGDVYPSAGQLRLTTVRVDTEVDLADAVASWFDDERALVPRGAVLPPGQSDQQVEQRNAEQFRSSLRSAEAVAFGTLGKPRQRVAVDAGEVGGPSAGLMLTLGIIDRLTPADLTGGRIIAGTGTIDDTGAVGPVSGIPQKLIGAKAAGAQLFLVPAANCAEAARNAVPGLPVARVATVGEALAAVRSHAAGVPPRSC